MLYELVTEKFNYEVSWTEIQSLWVFEHHQSKKGNENIFKFNATFLAKNQSPTPNNAIKCPIQQTLSFVCSNNHSFLCINYVHWENLGRDPFNQNFRKFWSQTQWISSVQPEKFRKNHLSRSHRWNFGWMDRALRLSRSYKMPFVGQSTTCKVFNMGDDITPSQAFVCQHQHTLCTLSYNSYV